MSLEEGEDLGGGGLGEGVDEGHVGVQVVQRLWWRC